MSHDLSGWSNVEKTLAKKQSYLQGWFEDKWVLLVGYSESMGSEYEGGHQAVINALEGHASKDGMTKGKLHDLRRELLEG